MISDIITTLKKEILSGKYIIIIFITALIFIAIAAYSINYRLVFETLSGDYPFIYKIRILTDLFRGVGVALSGFDLLFLIVASVLTGVNIALIIRSIEHMKESGGIKFAAGGGALLGFVSTGCASCGFSLFSVLGIGGVLGILPFGNHTLYILSIGLLLFSISYMTRELNKSRFCETK